MGCVAVSSSHTFCRPTRSTVRIPVRQRSVGLQQVHEENKVWRLKSLHAFQKRKGYDQMSGRVDSCRGRWSRMYFRMERRLRLERLGGFVYQQVGPRRIGGS